MPNRENWCPYIVMELLWERRSGGRRPRSPPPETRRLAMGLAWRWIAHAQPPTSLATRLRRKRRHRPVLLPLDVEPVLTDFGLARHINHRQFGVISARPPISVLSRHAVCRWMGAPISTRHGGTRCWPLPAFRSRVTTCLWR
jgi:hypothetical protein